MGTTKEKLLPCGCHDHRPRCRHCGRSTCPKHMMNGDYCQACRQVYSDEVGGGRHDKDAAHETTVTDEVDLLLEAGRWEQGLEVDHLRGARRCAVPGCLNHSDQGVFRGDFCAPCYDYVVKNEGRHSQAYRNELVKERLRTVSSVKIQSQVLSLANVHYNLFKLRMSSLYGKFGVRT